MFIVLYETIKQLEVNDDIDVVICFSAFYIIPVAKAVEGTNIAVGTENYIEDKGAYTSEISAQILLMSVLNMLSSDILSVVSTLVRMIHSLTQKL